MPRYELMYLLASQIAENEVPAISEQILKAIKDNEGTEITETQLGKKKLAYPIKKTRNGFYVVVNFVMSGSKLASLDAKIRSMDTSVIRYLITNQEQHQQRMAKDKIVQSKIVRKIPLEKIERVDSPKPSIKLEDIDEKMLDEKIDKALSEDSIK